MRHSIPAKSVVRILNAAARRGVSTAVACAAADLDPAALADPDARVPFSRVVRLSDAGARLSGDAAFGLHIGEASPAGTFDLADDIMKRSATVGEALDRLGRYQRVWTDGSALRAYVDGRRAQIDYAYDITDPGPEGRRQDCEAMLATLTARLRALVGAEWQPERVWCQHAAPADTSEHSRVFRCPIEFGQASNALMFDPRVLAHPIARTGLAPSAVLDRHPTAPSSGSLADRARHVLVSVLRGGDPDLATVARELGTSTRTLQRRLQDERTSLHDLIDDVRRDLSVRYLEQSDLTIADVAYLLGFAEPVTFHRAFRKWTGTTPGEFRRRVRAS